MRVRTFVSVTMAAMLLAILLPLLPFRAEAQPSHGGTITRVRPVVDGNVAVYDGITGFFIEDSGVSIASLTNYPSSYDAYTIPFATSNDIVLANGNLQWYAPTNTTTIYLPTDTSTTQVHSVRIDINPGTNSFTISTNNVFFTTNEVLGANASDVTIRTNGATTPLIFDKAYHSVNWRVWGL